MTGRAAKGSLRITAGASLRLTGAGKAPAAAPKDSQGSSASAWPAAAYGGSPAAAGPAASRTCSFDISPHRLHVQVMSKGRVIWDSADCRGGQPDRSIRFRRGVPAETYLTWRRIVSLPGCVTVASSARPGSYQVQAKDSSVASPVRSFKLVR